MKDLSVTYLGKKLKNPIIVGSSGLSGSLQKIRSLVDNNAAAVVLKSLFEEQILAELSTNMDDYHTDYPGAFDYVREYTRDNAVSDYLDLISDAKKEVDVPIFASINCVSSQEWLSFARSVEKAGADGLEINVSLLPSDIQKTCKNNEQIYFDVLESLSSEVSFPVVLKMSKYSSALANLVARLTWTGKVAGFVLFNRHYRPDINIEELTLTSSSVFSTPDDIHTSLRWIALLSESVETDFASSTGVHDSAGVVKQLLVGASAVQVVSALYKNGPQYINTLLQGLEEWMGSKSYTRIADFQGKLSYKQASDPTAFERVQFMKYYGGIE